MNNKKKEKGQDEEEKEKTFKRRRKQIALWYSFSGERITNQEKYFMEKI